MYVYIIRSYKDGSFYIGSTNDVNKRLKQHNHRESLSTKSKVPWGLVKVEQYDSKSLALKREKFLKTGRGRSTLINLFRHRE